MSVVSSVMFADPVTARIAQFLFEIGLRLERGPVPAQAILPGIHVENGVLIVDEARLAYCGDLLHEAGHLAVLPSREREGAGANVGEDGGEEIAAIAWSWAAAMHLRLDPSIVFHPHGYRGGSQAILENFRAGRYIGVPLLQWMGLTAVGPLASKLGVPPFPHMLRWLRE